MFIRVTNVVIEQNQERNNFNETFYIIIRLIFNAN